MTGLVRFIQMPRHFRGSDRKLAVSIETTYRWGAGGRRTSVPGSELQGDGQFPISATFACSSSVIPASMREIRKMAKATTVDTNPKAMKGTRRAEPLAVPRVLTDERG